MPTFVFAIAARIKLEQRLARSIAASPGALQRVMGDIETKLRAVFPGGDSVIIVQDLYSGFRIRPKEHILLVELAKSGGDDGLNVVKLGPAEKLSREWEAWKVCKPPGLKHDIVLMDLHRVPSTGDTIDALVYADAEQLIGVDQTMTLERAVLESIQFGNPKVESVAELLFQLYERLGLLLYRHSDDEDLGKQPLISPGCLDPHLLDNLAAWDQEGSMTNLNRSRANTQAQGKPWNRQFRDPVDTFRRILELPPSSVMPRMLRGRSHGDLHGRNVLVGKVGERVLWPTVYDFADMGPFNWIGWDFVKMETEIKIRAYPFAFDTVSVPYVIPFEVRLFEATESGRRTGDWGSLPARPSPEERLFWLILQIRKLASFHLSWKGRGSLWLCEYYFQLALYGLNAGRFATLSPVEQMGAYLSAGCAAARYAPV